MTIALSLSPAEAARSPRRSPRPAHTSAPRAFLALALAAMALAGCEPLPQQTRPAPAQSAAQDGPALSGEQAAQNFVQVVRRMEPAITAECRERTAGKADCGFQIVVDDSAGASPNAFQTLDKDGHPVVAFNLALIAEARNTDELAFVMGHEAAHHILGHIPRAQASASAGALILGGLATAAGYDTTTIQTAQNIGASFGGRAYAKGYELEADRLGTIIAYDAGYDPIRGARFFGRLPDPGDQFLGSHPPNTDRVRLVEKTVADLKTGRIR